MLSSEHKVFETSMFGISVVLTLALVIGIGYYISVAFFNHNTVTDEEANASAVSDSAVTVRESPEPTQTPDGNTMVREDDADTQVDEELAKATEGYTTSTVNICVPEPSLTASVVAKVPASTKLTSLVCRRKNGWKLNIMDRKVISMRCISLLINQNRLRQLLQDRLRNRFVQRLHQKATKAPKATKTPKASKSPKATKMPKATKTPGTVVTKAPTQAPTEAPTQAPTEAPTQVPTPEPTANTTE